MQPFAQTRAIAPALGQVVWLALALAALPGSAMAQVYGGESASGAVVLSYAQTAETPTLVVMAPPAAPDVVSAPAMRNVEAPRPVPKLPEHVKQLIQQVSRETGVSAPLIAAVAAAESGFNARAVSPKGAAGLMQLMPETARRFNVGNRLSPEQSVRGGAAYLRWLTTHFESNLEWVIAAYNAGENAVERAGGPPPLAETQAYLPRVLAYMRHFASVFSPTPG